MVLRCGCAKVGHCPDVGDPFRGGGAACGGRPRLVRHHTMGVQGGVLGGSGKRDGGGRKSKRVGSVSRPWGMFRSTVATNLFRGAVAARVVVSVVVWFGLVFYL